MNIYNTDASCIRRTIKILTQQLIQLEDNERDLFKEFIENTLKRVDVFTQVNVNNKKLLFSNIDFNSIDFFRIPNGSFYYSIVFTNYGHIWCHLVKYNGEHNGIQHKNYLEVFNYEPQKYFTCNNEMFLDLIESYNNTKFILPPSYIS